ncbi:MAG: hypothetical protein QXT22_05835 [Candidatus Hadarchaeales archaeon]
MNFWIEVTSGMRWERMLKEGIALTAPNRARYRTFFAKINSGDLVLHYITSTLTRQKELRSKVVAVSLIASTPSITEKRITAPCSNTLLLPNPVSLAELRKLKQKSPFLRKLVDDLHMQRYLTQITQSDFKSILGVDSENMRRFLKSRLGKWLTHHARQ